MKCSRVAAVNVCTFRDIQQIKAMLFGLEERINKVERAITDR